MTSFTLPTTCIDVLAPQHRRPETSVHKTPTSRDVRAPPTDVQRRQSSLHRRPETSELPPPTSRDVAPLVFRRPATSRQPSTDVHPFKYPSSHQFSSRSEKPAALCSWWRRGSEQRTGWLALRCAVVHGGGGAVVVARCSAGVRGGGGAVFTEFCGGSRGGGGATCVEAAWRRDVLEAAVFCWSSWWWRRGVYGSFVVVRGGGWRWWRRDVCELRGGAVAG